MGLLHRGQAMLNRRMNQAGGVAITYTRGATTITIAAGEGVWVGEARFAVNVEGGPKIVWGDRAYLIEVAAIAALGEPQEGDRIAETVNGVAKLYEVMLPGTGDPAERPSNREETRWRVNCKRVG